MNKRLSLCCQSVRFPDQKHHNTQKRSMRLMSIPFVFDFNFDLVALFSFLGGLLVPEVRKKRIVEGDGVEETIKGYIKVWLEGG
jgi:hypothetical protein